MTSTLICDALAGKLAAYVEGAVTGPDATVIAEHLDGCAECRAAAERFGAVKNLLEYAQLEEPVAPVTAEQQPVAARLGAWLSSAPWWAVSCALHVLVIALAGLASMAIQLPHNDDAVIMMTELRARPELPVEDKREDNPVSALESPRDVAATDPASKDMSSVVVPPDIAAKAELGDHFETINPDIPDDHSALGNPDAQSFHSVSGNTEAAGGGGTGGVGMEDLIGVGAAGTRGSGGGFGGGDGTGTGVGSGSGHGSFGNRSGGGRKLMIKRHGGSVKTESAVEKALEWLAKNQDQDGHWDAQKLEGTCAEKTWADVGMTGIATLAFLGAGHTERVGKYKENVQRAVYWLVDKQIKEGKGKGSWGTLMYPNGIATLALAEATGMSRNSEAKQAAQMGVDYIQQAQHEYMAWDYYANTDGNARNDTSVSGWQVMALKSAKVAGLKVDARAFEGAINWLDVGQNLPKDLKDSYEFEGGMMVYQGKRGDISGPSMSMTAAAALMRIFMGYKTDSPAVAGPCNLMKHEKPAKDHGITVPCTDPYPPACPGKGIDYYYWYYGTFAMFQMGGDHWTVWNEHLKSTLLPMQRQDGVFAGSWDPVGGGRIPDGGRVFSTALGALCLEVYYRYAKLNEK
jgi:hypothetical protein